MSHSPLPNHLRPCRKALGLTQHDVAYLLGSRDSNKVSRFERFVREPTLRNAIACEVIFSMSCTSLFPGIVHDVETEVRQRAKRLSDTAARRSALPQHDRRLTNLRLLAERCSSRRANV